MINWNEVLDDFVKLLIIAGFLLTLPLWSAVGTIVFPLYLIAKIVNRNYFRG